MVRNTGQASRRPRCEKEGPVQSSPDGGVDPMFRSVGTFFKESWPHSAMHLERSCRCLLPGPSHSTKKESNIEGHGQTVAAKKVTRGGKNRLAQRQSFWAELNAAPLPRHPNLLRLLAASACPPPEEPLCLGVVLLEYAAGGTLHRAIYSAPAEELCARRCLGYARDLARGLGFLHAHSLVHLDLKPANVLLAPGLPGPGPPRYTCKIGDFGSSQRLQREPAPPAHTGGGTYTHRAPELLRGLPASRRADIYSFAVTLWQMLSRQHPYVGRERHSVLYAVVAQGLRPELTAAAFCPPAPGARFTGLIRRCWSPQPEQRPAARSLLQELEIMPDSESSRPLAQWNMTLPPATVATEL